MLIKVCGMRSEEQVYELDGIVDFIGFIFYANSKRFVEVTPFVENALKVGVFVNEPVDTVMDHIERHALDIVQLHGNESPEVCELLQQKTRIIKAFGVDEEFSFKKTRAYEGRVDHFLFDTKTTLHGGSGKQFDWSKLSKYKGSVPFLLSGGIDLNSVESLKNVNHPKLIGVDVNSRFEHSPGDKNITELKQFIKELRK